MASGFRIFGVQGLEFRSFKIEGSCASRSTDGDGAGKSCKHL